MVLRSALGSLGVVAVIGAVVAAMPERGGSPSSSTPKAPYGILGSPPSVAAANTTDAAAAKAVGQQDRPVELASFEGSRDPVVPAVVASGESEASTVASALPQSPAASGPVRNVAVQPTATTIVPVAASQVKVASTEAPASADAGNATPEPSGTPNPALGGGVNINTASIAELDHLPGVGRIGRTIAHHRPYRTVEDLVRKRVLREAAFRKIRPLISAD